MWGFAPSCLVGGSNVASCCGTHATVSKRHLRDTPDQRADLMALVSSRRHYVARAESDCLEIVGAEADPDGEAKQLRDRIGDR